LDVLLSIVIVAVESWTLALDQYQPLVAVVTHLWYLQTSSRLAGLYTVALQSCYHVMHIHRVS